MRKAEHSFSMTKGFVLFCFVLLCFALLLILCLFEREGEKNREMTKASQVEVRGLPDVGSFPPCGLLVVEFKFLVWGTDALPTKLAC